MRKAALIFPGQSSQRKGMLKDLYEESALVRQTFAEASEIMKYNLSQICFEEEKEKLQDISISAPIIVTANVASFRYFINEFQLTPSYLAGHSLGEYSALTCAGVLSFKESLQLVTYRAQLAQRAMIEKEGVMTAIYNIPFQEIDDMCRRMRSQGVNVWLSCYNSPVQCCVSGSHRDIEQLEARAAKNGASVRRLIGNAPFHSPMMVSIVEELADYMRGCHIQAPSFPVISNWCVRPYHQDSVIENLLQQLIHPVKWLHSMEYLRKQHTDIWIELGSGQVLSKLLKSSHVECYNIENRRTLARELHAVQV